MKTHLTIAVALGAILAASSASLAASLVPGSGADFTSSPEVKVVPKPRSDDAVTTDSTRGYSTRPATRRATDQSDAERDSADTRPIILVPGSDADFSN
ncbi:hypothetical protein [Jiella avicenniae]|uniref:Serine protease n=1 Tax=Jiella avicenniae TaxID=2907202 RepID=A0A9X1NZP1_9HYPH|nr:hypothetical protein [Jiella avicenniae]MCE7026658.1 hypothetical protein [Jiella avicenniae]